MARKRMGRRRHKGRKKETKPLPHTIKVPKHVHKALMGVLHHPSEVGRVLHHMQNVYTTSCHMMNGYNSASLKTTLLFQKRLHDLPSGSSNNDSMQISDLEEDLHNVSVYHVFAPGSNISKGRCCHTTQHVLKEYNSIRDWEHGVFSPLVGCIAPNCAQSEVLQTTVIEKEPENTDGVLIRALSHKTESFVEENVNALLDKNMIKVMALLSRVADISSGHVMNPLSIYGPDSNNNVSSSSEIEIVREPYLISHHKNPVLDVILPSALAGLFVYLPMMEVIGVPTKRLSNAATRVLFPHQYYLIEECIRNTNASIINKSHIVRDTVVDTSVKELRRKGYHIIRSMKRDMKDFGSMTVKAIRLDICDNISPSTLMERFSDIVGAMVIVDEIKTPGLAKSIGAIISKAVRRKLEEEGIKAYVDYELIHEKKDTEFVSVHVNIKPEDNTFFPVELQIMDYENYLRYLIGLEDGHFKYGVNKRIMAITFAFGHSEKDGKTNGKASNELVHTLSSTVRKLVGGIEGTLRKLRN